MQHHKEDANQNQRSKDKKQSGDGTSTPDPLSSEEVTVLENLIKLVDFLTSTNDDVIKEFEKEFWISRGLDHNPANAQSEPSSSSSGLNPEETIMNAQTRAQGTKSEDSWDWRECRVNEGD